MTAANTVIRASRQETPRKRLSLPGKAKPQPEVPPAAPMTQASDDDLERKRAKARRKKARKRARLREALIEQTRAMRPVLSYFEMADGTAVRFDRARLAVRMIQHPALSVTARLVAGGSAAVARPSPCESGRLPYMVAASWIAPSHLAADHRISVEELEVAIAEIVSANLGVCERAENGELRIIWAEDTVISANRIPARKPSANEDNNKKADGETAENREGAAANG